MSKPKNQYLVTRIKAAITANIRPSAMLYHDQPNGAWTEEDFKILEAYQILQDEICPQCGNPIWLCRSNDDSVSWTVEKSVCRASRALEEKAWRDDKTKKHTATKEEKANWGVSRYAVPKVSGHMPEGTELPTREDFYRG